VQIWGSGQRAGLYPLSDTLVYWFISFNQFAHETPHMSAEEMKRDARRLVQGWHFDIMKCVENTESTGITRSRFFDRWQLPFGGLGTGCVTLAGDAMHPMTPNLGQGGCVALEDGIVLTRHLQGVWSRSDRDIETALRRYEEERLNRCLKLVVRSNLIGTLAQSANPLLMLARDTVAQRQDAAHFFDHALYDCGSFITRRPAE
jgi:2-polyprenyl-6-methoxyphenol hydroxylase-like FAD-dependent oxidoreductase